MYKETEMFQQRIKSVVNPQSSPSPQTQPPLEFPARTFLFLSPHVLLSKEYVSAVASPPGSNRGYKGVAPPDSSAPRQRDHPSQQVQYGSQIDPTTIVLRSELFQSQHKLLFQWYFQAFQLGSRAASKACGRPITNEVFNAAEMAKIALLRDEGLISFAHRMLSDLTQYFEDMSLSSRVAVSDLAREAGFIRKAVKDFVNLDGAKAVMSILAKNGSLNLVNTCQPQSTNLLSGMFRNIGATCDAKEHREACIRKFDAVLKMDSDLHGGIEQVYNRLFFAKYSN